jgi:hypothetical protein
VNQEEVISPNNRVYSAAEYEKRALEELEERLLHLVIGLCLVAKYLLLRV